jgi:hypothetical protein
MRKKSHLALAQYLIRQECTWTIQKHKKAFYLGSILPDLNPKMFAAPHEYVTSYEKLQERIRSLTEGWDASDSPRVFWRRLGIVLHYLADYFTYPHNVTYDGTLANHCTYEGDLKHLLRAYVKTDEAADVFFEQKYDRKRFASVEELFEYIEAMHEQYLISEHTAESDCRWIVELCSQVLVSVVSLVERNADMEFDICAA